MLNRLLAPSGRARVTLLAAVATWAPVVVAAAQDDTCPVPAVSDPVVITWSNQVVGAIVGGDACYASPDAFRNSDCNIFVGRVLEQLYHVTDFRAQAGSAAPYLTSNDIAVLLTGGTVTGWQAVGALTDAAALQRAHDLASQNTAVVAVWLNPDGGPGHVVLIGPGPLTVTGSLGQAPVSASFFQGHPWKNYIGKPVSCGFSAAQRPTTKIYARTGPG
jgi:hypothetical protein